VRNFYVVAIVALAALSVACAGGIIYGDASGQWYFGGALIGVLLLCYSFIILFLRKLGLIGPRKAER
jgi:hypothetical protein